MPDRSCPACHEPVAAHQTLCPSCRAPVPSEAGPVATDSQAFTFAAPPPRHPRPQPPATTPAPATPAPEPPGPFPGSPQPQPAPVFAGTLGSPGAAQLDERGNLPGGLAGLVAAALVTVGVFLPWIGVEGRDVSGWAASEDAKALLGIAGLATVFAALLIGGARSLVLRLGLVGLGIATLGLGAYEVASANGIDDFEITLGTGLFLVLAGGLVLAVAGLLTRHRRFR